MNILAGLFGIFFLIGIVGVGLCLLEKLVNRSLNKLDFLRADSRWRTGGHNAPR